MSESRATWIEFHDSFIRGLRVMEAELVLSLYAVVHTDPDGSVSYTGWQEHRLSFKDFSMTCSRLGHGDSVDAYLLDGVVKLDGKELECLLASTTRLTGAVEISLWPSPNFERVVISATSLTVEPVGPVKWEHEPPEETVVPSTSEGR